MINVTKEEVILQLNLCSIIIKFDIFGCEFIFIFRTRQYWTDIVDFLSYIKLIEIRLIFMKRAKAHVLAVYENESIDLNRFVYQY